MSIEGVVRPFSNRNVFPVPFTRPGQQGSEMVRIAIGFQGTLKTMGYSFSGSMSSKMGQVHKERNPNSDSLKSYMGSLPAG